MLIPLTIAPLPSRTENNKYTANGINYSFAAQQQQTNNENGVTSKSWKEYLEGSGFCDEAKITDLALVLFTYCLVIVGWFGIRSGERNTEATERSYFFLGYNKITYDQGVPTIPLVVTNVGKMPGAITEVGFKFLKRAGLPAVPKNADWNWEISEYGWVRPPNKRTKLKTLRSPHKGNQIFVGYVKYEDIFSGKSRRSARRPLGIHAGDRRSAEAR